MNNVVTEIDILKDKIETEVQLRHAADVEMRNNGAALDGPMVTAHTASVEEVVQAARALIEKADAG